MAHGVEIRNPFLDVNLVEFLFRSPSAIKISSGWTKHPLRALLSKAGLQEVAWRRDKEGFPTPLSHWIQEDGGAWLRGLLAEGSAQIAEFCYPERVRKLIAYHVGGGYGAANHLYRLLSTELWLQECVAR